MTAKKKTKKRKPVAKKANKKPAKKAPKSKSKVAKKGTKKKTKGVKAAKKEPLTRTTDPADKRHKLSDAQVRGIRKLYNMRIKRKKGGMSQAAIARKFNLSVIHVNRLVNGVVRRGAGGIINQPL